MCLLGLFRLPVSEVIARWTEREDGYAVWQGTDSHQVRLSLRYAILFRNGTKNCYIEGKPKQPLNFPGDESIAPRIGATNCYIYIHGSTEHMCEVIITVTKLCLSWLSCLIQTLAHHRYAVHKGMLQLSDNSRLSVVQPGFRA